jgi:hypothetical protein
LTGDAYGAFFERLAQGVERSWRVLAELVQKERSPVGERDLAGSDPTAAAADECRD